MKTIFITGGSTGIGAACVRRFFSDGWNVGFMDINRQAALALLEELGGDHAGEEEVSGLEVGDGGCAGGERLLFVEGDTRSKEDIHRAVEAVVARFGGLDSVFANAGIHRSNTILDISDEELDLMVRTNIYGTVNTLREAVPQLIKAGGGTIVINSSDQWFIGKAHSFAYGMTKGATGQIVRSLSIDLGKYNIRVNAVCPGTIATPLVDGVFERYSEAHGCSVEDCWKEENGLFARGSVGRPEEVAAMVSFLASDESGFCTGGHYLIDGGLVAGR